ncbi:hypothetical protein FB567DRAFT_556608 [Paraphoma chrysanthemicola]|uniref:Ubiquitin-like domain-containing protein n=1 Tax=Paraphoma chrysanthemicola TaxID=798071 RepID=A0A8K0RIE7_9PLEO|nr:hypothetical protein FB567DRAFT_556608 [Paraphoma chrysanthemicola]
MPVTFGAVGDIISVCLLVKDLVDALDKTRGSKAEYQSLIRELWILDRSLLEIDLLARTHGGGGTPELEALCNTATKAVHRCRELVSDFSSRVKNKQDAMLITINERLESTNRLIDSGNGVTTKIAEALRLDWFRQLGSELKGYMRRIIAMNIATYHAVISIQSSLPGRLERGLIEEPFILEDAIGRIAPVHLQFVTSWDAFNAVLEIRFREMQGFQKIKKKQYGLQEKATKREIEQSRPWQRAFLPGQRIEMSFLFDTQDSESGVDNVSCPGCQTMSSNPTDAEIQCENCRMWFRRITVVHDVEPAPQVPIPSPWRSRAEFGKPGLSAMVSGPVRPGKKRVAPADLDGEDDVREFKRRYTGGVSIEKVTTGQDIFGIPKWPTQENFDASNENLREVHSATAPNNQAQGDLLRKEAWMGEKNLLRSRFGRLASPPAIEAEDIVDTELVKNALVLMSGPRHLPKQFFFPDVTRVTFEGLKKAEEYLDLAKWNNFETRYIDRLWPVKSCTIFISSGLILGLEKADCSLITHAAAKHGTPFRLPYAGDVIYGAAIGRWILDWTCHLFIADEFMVRAALHFWNKIYIIEKYMFMLKHGSEQLWGISEEADMSFNHFIVCYSCFTGHMLFSMDVLRMPFGRKVKGSTLPTMKDYARAFLSSFFFLARPDVSGPYGEALWLLDLCAEYYDAGLELLPESLSRNIPVYVYF